MIMINKAFLALKKGKRAVSPVVAAILMIGLTVAAGAIVFFIVLPLFETEPNIEINKDSTHVKYSQTQTEVEKEGWGEGVFTIINKGNGDAEITSITVEYFDVNILPDGDFVEITDKLIYESFPLEIGPASESQMTVYFKLADDNKLNSVRYQFLVNERTTGTTTVKEGTSGLLSLSKDTPDLSYTISSFVRRTFDVAPTVSDNSQIKNITFYVDYNDTYNDTNGIAFNHTIFDAPWAWSWNTYDGTTYGINATEDLVSMRIVVYDYAELSATVDLTNVDIDNDYTSPVVQSFDTYSPYAGNNTIELGQQATIRAEVTDTGCNDSGVSNVILWYALGNVSDPETTLKQASMIQSGTSDYWDGVISSDSTGLNGYYKNLTYWIQAYDKDDNAIDSLIDDPIAGNKTAIFEDNHSPDISHSPIATAYYRDAVQINATITDPSGATAHLWYRTSNDTEFTAAPNDYDPYSMTNTTTTYSFTIPADVMLLDGVDYYINASDLFGNEDYSNSTAEAGIQDGPWHIEVIDDKEPWVYQEANNTQGVSAVNLTLYARVYDNDKSFANDSSFQTGQLYLYYRQGTTSSWNEDKMNATSYTAVSFDPVYAYKITQWEGVIPEDFMHYTETTYYYIAAKDRAFNWPVPGYNNTGTWGTPANPNAITVNIPSEPTLSRSSEPSLNANGDTITYTLQVSGSICSVTQVLVDWDNSSVELVDFSIAGAVAESGGPYTAGTMVNIQPDKALGIAEYEIKMLFDNPIYDMQLTNRFDTDYDSSSKTQANITFTAPSQQQSAPQFTLISGFYWPGRSDRMYVEIQNDGAAVWIAGYSLSWTTGGNKRIRETYMGPIAPPSISVQTGDSPDQGSPITQYPFDVRNYQTPSGGQVFYIGWRFRRDWHVSGDYTLQLIDPSGTFFVVTGSWSL